MYEYFLRRNLDFLRAGFYAQGSSQDFSEGAGRVLGETPDTRERLSGIEGGRKSGDLVRTIFHFTTDHFPLYYGPFSTLLRTIFHFTTDSYGLVRTDSYGRSFEARVRTRTDSYGRTSYGPFSTLLRTIFHFTTDETPLPIISPG